MANAYQASSSSSSSSAAKSKDIKDKNDGAITSGPVLYFFNHTLALLEKAEPFDPEDIDSMGVFHGSELPFVFDLEVAERGESFF